MCKLKHQQTPHNREGDVDHWLRYLTWDRKVAGSNSSSGSRGPTPTHLLPTVLSLFGMKMVGFVSNPSDQRTARCPRNYKFTHVKDPRAE